MSFGGRRNGGQPPAVKNPKGSVKFWIKNGVLTKYQYNVQGTINRNDEDVDIDRTTTVEIKDVGTTKITVPDCWEITSWVAATSSASEVVGFCTMATL